MNVLNHLKKSFALDYRSLALYRALMGVIVMADVWTRLPDVVNFYTDIGLIPRGIFINEMGMPWSFSLHLANGSSGFAFTLFALHFIFGLMLLLGYQTRWACIGAFVMTVSVHNRNWLVNNGGDDILRAILFISIFLPLNQCFSLDSALRKKKSPLSNDHYSTWGWTFFLQVFVIYFIGHILKDHPIWRSNYTAVFYSSRLDIFATPIGVWLRDYPLLMKFSTFFTIWLEFAGPLVLIFSFVFGKFWWVARLGIIILFWALHVGIILTMWIGVFPYLCLVMWSIFIPGPYWDKVKNKFLNKGIGTLKIYYDHQCRFCEKLVLIIREFFLFSNVEIREAQSDQSINKDMIKQNSWVVVNSKGERFYHFLAMLEVMRHSFLLRYFVPILERKIFLTFFNHLYHWVAKHRKQLSQYSQFLVFTEEKKKIPWLSWIYQILGCFIFVTLLMWNLCTIKKWDIQAPFFQTITRWLHLYQEWNMFAPFPKMDNIWVEIPAVLSDGQEIELITGDRNIYEIKDYKFPSHVPNEHWRKFYLNLAEKTDNARYYGGFLCRAWNDRNIRHVENTTLRKFEIIVYSQMNLIDGDKGGISQKLSWKHWCFDEDYKAENPGITH